MFKFIAGFMDLTLVRINLFYSLDVMAGFLTTLYTTRHGASQMANIGNALTNNMKDGVDDLYFPISIISTTNWENMTRL